MSALHELNRIGYLCFFLTVSVGIAFFYKEQIFTILPDRKTLLKRKQRFKRKFPLAFLILATMAIAGGVIYPPTNYDALAYRIPRILHWLAEGQWHWIHTAFQRLNTRATGFEWLAAPIILFTKTDRFIFLINAISFLLLPGLVFSVFTRVGVRPRVAWYWMWIVPAGYCFLMQAGSVANDMFSAVFALAALDFALRAKTSSNGHTAGWLSVIAAALLTGSKASNIPLLLPWVIAILPVALHIIRTRPLLFALVAVIAAMSSLLPISTMNIKYCRDWTGSVAEGAKFGSGNPWVCLEGNTILLTVDNLAPPIFPFATLWNENARKFIPAAFGESLDRNFEKDGARLGVPEMQLEEGAGIGFGISALLLVTMVAALLRPCLPSGGNWKNPYGCPWKILFLLSPYVALLAFMAKSGLSGGARLLTPYYALLMPLMLAHRSHSQLIKKRWWKRLAFILVFLLSGLLIIVQPARPLWPENYVFSHFFVSQNAPLIARTRAVFAGYQERSYAFAPALDILPPGVDVLGFVSFDDPETSLWKPFGKRIIRHVTPNDSFEDLQRSHIKYVLASSQRISEHWGVDFDEWLHECHGIIVRKIPLALKIKQGPKDWVLVEIQSQ